MIRGGESTARGLRDESWSCISDEIGTVALVAERFEWFDRSSSA